MVFDFNGFCQFFIDWELKKAEQKTKKHKWFAWYPVKVGYCRWVWLKDVCRVYKPYGDLMQSIFGARYHDPKYYELLKD